MVVGQSGNIKGQSCMEIQKEIKESYNEMVQLRRWFHQHPELGFQEEETSQYIKDYLRKCDLRVITIAKTGVVGLLRGTSDGPTLLLRADMDALPIQEKNVIPYCSLYDGRMHACGHDGHMSILLVVAKILSRFKERIKGNIKFAFQPSEENGGGALKMINEGVLEDPPVNACMGLHLWSFLPTGAIGIESGPIMAGREHLVLTIKGKGGHTAAPHEAIDPIICTANIIQSLQQIQTRELNPDQKLILMFGKIQGGTAANVIPEKVELEGTIRYLFEDDSMNIDDVKQRIEKIIRSLCDAYKTDYTLEYKYSFPQLINNESLTDFIISVVEKCNIHSQKLNIVPLFTMASEDFAEFAIRVPSCFFFVGANNGKKETSYPHHHPNFNFDEKSLMIGTEVYIRCILEYFKTYNKK